MNWPPKAAAKKLAICQVLFAKYLNFFAAYLCRKMWGTQKKRISDSLWIRVRRFRKNMKNAKEALVSVRAKYGLWVDHFRTRWWIDRPSDSLSSESSEKPWRCCTFSGWTRINPEGTVLSGPLWSGGDGSFRTIVPVNGINTENGLSVSYISSNPNPENILFPLSSGPFPCTIRVPRKGWDEELTHVLGGLLLHSPKGGVGVASIFNLSRW